MLFVAQIVQLLLVQALAGEAQQQMGTLEALYWMMKGGVVPGGS
jgi:hypothetical protein